MLPLNSANTLNNFITLDFKEMKCTFKKIFLLLPFVATATENFHVSVINNTFDTIQLHQGYAIDWVNAGDLWKRNSVDIPIGNTYSYDASDNNNGFIDQDGFYLIVHNPKNNYANIFNAVLRNEASGTPFLDRKGPSIPCNNGKNHDVTIKVQQDGTVGLSCGGQFFYENIATYGTLDRNHVYNNYRNYDDVYGSLADLTPYDYYHANPDKITPNMRLIESTHDVQLISRGHISQKADSLFVKVSLTNEPGVINSACNFQSGMSSILIPGKILTKTTKTYKQISKPIVTGMEDNDQLSQDLVPLFRQDFAINFPLHPEKYFAWPGTFYTTDVPHSVNDIDTTSYGATLLDANIESSIVVLDNPNPIAPNQVIVALLNQLDNNTGITQTMTTSSYSHSTTNSETQTLTNGWKSTFKVPLIGGPEITAEYSGSFSNAVTNSTTDTINIPSQNILVPPGCIAVAQAILSTAQFDSNYTAYGTLAKNITYTMATPWKNMPADGTISSIINNNAHRPNSQSGVFPWTTNFWQKLMGKFSKAGQ